MGSLLASRAVGARSIAVYASGAFLQGAIGILIIPLLLRLMDPVSFASWVLFEPIVMMTASVGLLGAQHGQLQKIASGLMEQADALRTLLRCGMPTAAVIAAVGSAALLWISRDPGLALVSTGFALIFLEAMTIGLQYQARALSDSACYSMSVWVRSLLLVGSLSALLALGVSLTFVGYLYLIVVVDCLVILSILRKYARPFKAALSTDGPSGWSVFSSWVKYGLPIAVVSCLTVAGANADRYIVGHAMDRDQLAAYAVIVKLAGAMSFVASPINLWWPTVRHAQVRQKNGPYFFSMVIPLFVLYYAVAALSLFAVIQFIAPFYAPQYAIVSQGALAILLSSWVFVGLLTIFNIGSLEPGRTHTPLLTSAASIIIGLACGAVLTPRLGYVGAAMGTVMCQACGLIGIAYLSNKYYPIPYRWKEIGAISLLGLLAGCVAFFCANYLIRGIVIILYATAGVVALKRNLALCFTERRNG